MALKSKRERERDRLDDFSEGEKGTFFGIQKKVRHRTDRLAHTHVYVYPEILEKLVYCVDEKLLLVMRESIAK